MDGLGRRLTLWVTTAVCATARFPTNNKKTRRETALFIFDPLKRIGPKSEGS